MMQQALVVIEPEQQRADHRLAFVVAKAADHAVGAAVVLDLLHAVAFAGAVGQIAPLGDDAVERRADALEPALARRSSLVVAGDRRNAACLASIFGERFQPRAPLAAAAARSASRRRPPASRSNTIRSAGVSSASLLHAALRRMDALQQRVEGERAVVRHDDLAIEHEFLRLQRASGVDQFGKIARQRLAGFRLQLDLVAVAEDEAAKAVPFRLVLPIVATGMSSTDSASIGRETAGARKGHGGTLQHAKLDRASTQIGRPFAGHYERNSRAAGAIRRRR